MDFGRVALAGAFLKPGDFAAERSYPLTLRFCEKCLLVQIGEHVDPETLFAHYFYFTSATKTMRAHFQRLAHDLVAAFRPRSVIEIGCNDGALLSELQRLGVSRLLGVDPARNVTPAHLPIINAYWGGEVVRSVLGGERFDLVVANNVFAHLADINDACEAVALALAPDGAFVFEVTRLDEMVAGLQYDWVYHEHRYYYSLVALDNLLARHGLEVWDLQSLPTHAGSMRYYAGRKGRHDIAPRVHEQRKLERRLGLHAVDTFHRFAQRARGHSEALAALVRSFARVAGYGACGRTNTMLQAAGLGSEDLEYLVDDAPAKQGFYTPGSHIEISPAARLVQSPPECVIVFAWSFFAEIRPKLAGFPGKVYLPLPHIQEHAERAAA